MSCIETELGVGTVGVWADIEAACEYLDPFQHLGIPCWQGCSGPLDNPNEPDTEGGFEP